MISYLDDGIVSKMSKFADDAKLCSVVGDDEEAHILHIQSNKNVKVVAGLANVL